MDQREITGSFQEKAGFEPGRMDRIGTDGDGRRQGRISSKGNRGKEAAMCGLSTELFLVELCTF